ncbi:jg6502 [Pararge aegeria aegeria]|uniref:Jg6502 protein n=1 Tax=Pararge aegeria aegeria TaxID=348720 RepID=A0A8S4SRP8_9NEOP|nr:jg6502 [Pararge aegeria aegeria]
MTVDCKLQYPYRYTSRNLACIKFLQTAVRASLVICDAKFRGPWVYSWLWPWQHHFSADRCGYGCSHTIDPPDLKIIFDELKIKFHYRNSFAFLFHFIYISIIL